ncbi:MAG: hypothetical protein HY362_02535 [Candidatus Aenigmarchaeota archaeon]|nr:hypothetical protein [Candidatus Aenigmarchaeota archaeon]
MITLVVNEPSWEDVILKIVAEEGMDPWAVDLIKLADAFNVYLQKIGEMDLRVPARFILIAAILLRMKSDIFAAKKLRTVLSDSEKPPDPMLKILAEVPPLQPPLKRIPLGSVTVDELISALKKAFEVKERRTIRKDRLRRAVAQVLPVDQEDITDRIEKLYSQINSYLTELQCSVEFSKLVKTWERRSIVRTLLPLLHLTQEGKVDYRQEQVWGEIIVEGKKNESKA